MKYYGSIFKENKYHNQKCIYDGMVFDSKKERDYYQKLEILQKYGKITDLKRQVEFVLLETFQLEGKTYRKTKYIADFTYKDEKRQISCGRHEGV